MLKMNKDQPSTVFISGRYEYTPTTIILSYTTGNDGGVLRNMPVDKIPVFTLSRTNSSFEMLVDGGGKMTFRRKSATIGIEIEATKKDLLILDIVSQVRFLAERGDHKSAIAKCTEGLAVDRHDYWMNMEMGKSFRALGQYEDALPYFVQAAQTDMGSEWAAYFVAEALESMEQYYDAIVWAKKAIGNYSGQTHAYVTLVKSLQKIGRYDESEKYLTLGLSRKSEYADALNALKELKKSNSRFPLAIYSSTGGFQGQTSVNDYGSGTRILQTSDGKYTNVLLVQSGESGWLDGKGCAVSFATTKAAINVSGIKEITFKYRSPDYTSPNISFIVNENKDFRKVDLAGVSKPLGNDWSVVTIPVDSIKNTDFPKELRNLVIIITDDKGTSGMMYLSDLLLQ